ncbi:MAG TPA: 1-deoxy-D-xylulose-5-phosphate reductoisomerase [Dehalococcoidia bacterium]|nr:1-deoxy-D-xylulose-5-phosphate reductoisomerase [Dehalococcoidia bacterium]
MHEKTNVALIGSTGSIGRQTLDVIRNHSRNFRVTGLAAGKNTAMLEQQIAEFRPQLVHSLSPVTLPPSARIVSPEEIASDDEVDLVVIATAGKAGLNPTLAAIKSTKRVALANKEVLVMAGHIIMESAKLHGASILPVDSEHSAIWQCLSGESAEISRLIITASGGPFHGYDSRRLSEVSVEQTLNHPTWNMGRKVTVDSATLMNKGLEVIEAHWLFGLSYEKIEIVVHAQSIIHSMVEFIDGSIKAQMSYPDMHLPIQYALTYPGRLLSVLPRLDITAIQTLSFEPLDDTAFPCVSLALEAGRRGGTHPSALCAADEIAVQLFLERKIKFTDIAHIIGEVMQSHAGISHPCMEEILQVDAWARDKAMDIYHKRQA